jgi:HNH endonuclease
MSDDECWTWLKGKTSRGYGVFWFDGRHPGYAHRIAYKLFYGEVPNGMEIDHKCRNSSCCNPNHLEAVTHKTNIRRSPNVGRPSSHGVMCSPKRTEERVKKAYEVEGEQPKDANRTSNNGI